MPAWAIPAVMSAGSNVLGGIGANQATNGYYQSLKNSLPGLQDQYAAAMQQSVAGWQPYATAGTTALSDLQAWRPEQMGQFTYNKDVNAFLDPSMAFQNEQMNAALAESQLGQGRALGGAAAKELSAYNAKLAQTDYANAYSRMTNDKSSVYQQFLNEFNARNAASQGRYNQLASLTNLGTTAQGNITSANQSVAGGAYNTGMTLAQAKAQKNAANSSFGWDLAAGLLGAGGQAAGAYQAQQNWNNLIGAVQPQQSAAPAVQPMTSGLALSSLPTYTPPTQQQQLMYPQAGINPSLLPTVNTNSSNLNLNSRTWR